MGNTTKTMKLLLENWRQYLNESPVREAIVDVVSDELSDIFEDGTLRPEVIKTIKKGVSEIKQQFSDLEILDYFLVGAAVTYQYSNTSDIDTTIVVPENMNPQQYKLVDKWIENNIDPKYAFKKRPYQFKITLASDVSRDNLRHTDSAYDVENQSWIKKPDLGSAKQQYKKTVADPQSYENKIYKAIERSIQPSLVRLERAIDSELDGQTVAAINEGSSEELKNLMNTVYTIYEKIKSMRSRAYSGKDRRVKQRISQNWGTGNIIYKFLDREGYNNVFAMIKKAVRSNFEIVDQKFLKNLKQRLSTVVDDEIGFKV
jgi:hypothetical protein